MANVQPERVQQKIDDFVFHLKSGFLITKIPNNSFRNKQRRVLYCDASGHTINWREAKITDYPTKAEYEMDIGDSSFSTSKKKKGIPLSSLQSVQYSVDHYKENSFFMRLVFESRNLDIELLNKEDFEYCMDGFELIAKNVEKFAVRASFRPESEQQIWDEMGYEPVVWRYKRADGTDGECHVGCGNDWEDIFLITSCYLCLWSLLLAFYGLLLKGALDSDESSTLLMEFLGFGVLFVCMVALAVVTGQWELEATNKKRKRLGLKDDEPIPDDDDE